MLFRYIGLDRAAELLERAIEETVEQKIVTYDLARQMDSVSSVTCSAYGEAIKKRIGDYE